MKKFLKKIFSAIDKLSVKKNKLFFIPKSEIEYFYIDVQKYNGKEVKLSDGAIISKGDKVIELHLNNSKMNNIKKGELKKIVHIIDLEMELLSKEINNNDELINSKAIYGRTVLYPLVIKKGFDVIDINKKGMKLFLSFWDNIIKVVFSSGNEKFKKREPKEIWISRDKLIARYKD